MFTTTLALVTLAALETSPLFTVRAPRAPAAPALAAPTAPAAPAPEATAPVTPAPDAAPPAADVTPAAPAAPDASAGALDVWRPFSDDSPWNTPIPAGAALAPDSVALIEDLATSSPFGEALDVNIARYSIPLFFADDTTPTIPMTARVAGEGWGAGGFDVTLDMPLPPGATPDPESDHHIAVIDRAKNLEWGCWDTQLHGGSGTAGLCAVSDLSGTGVRPRHDVASPWSAAHGARACGFPLVAGLIRPEEIAAGRIEHALAIAYPHIRAGWYTPPASTAQARVGDNSISTRGIPCGGRVQLDPAVDVDAMNVSREAKVILKALQEYGAFVGDYSGGITIYAEGSADAQTAWDGVLSTDELRSVLDLRDLRVLELGPLFDNGNGG